MCQAFAGEQQYLFSVDRDTRMRGYDAQKKGIKREDNPERDHQYSEYSQKNQWWNGWDTAADGRKVW